MGKQGDDSRDNLSKSEVMPEPRYPKESLLSRMIPLIFLPTYTIQHGKPLHNTHIHSLSDLSFHPQECGCLEALFCPEGTPDGSVMTNAMFPIAYGIP